jgi:hypothetical protein
MDISFLKGRKAKSALKETFFKSVFLAKGLEIGTRLII